MADNYAVVCLDTIDDIEERSLLIETLEGSGKEIIEISEEQKQCFAGNMLQLLDEDGKTVLVMSSAAHQSLDKTQLAALEAHNPILHSNIDTIEICGGGSARCMMAEVFLPKI